MRVIGSPRHRDTVMVVVMAMIVMLSHGNVFLVVVILAARLSTEAHFDKIDCEI